MVRYGGPRFEFFFTHHFLNNEMLIKKENAQRVAFIRRQREKKLAEEEERLVKERQAEEERLRMEAEAEAAKRYAVEKVEARQRRRAQKHRRLNELAQPRTRSGRRETTVALPALAAGTRYMPGVDRHRIVPPRPSPNAHLPWVGTGVEWLEAEKKAKEDLRYYFAAPPQDFDRAAVNAKKKCVDGIEWYHTRRGKKKTETEKKDEDKPVDDGLQLPEVLKQTREGAESPASVFSHGSSNGPIKALGTRHMDAITTKPEVQQHLARYGGAMVPPLQEVKPVTPFDSMTLSELTARLVRMQQRLRV